MRSRPNRAEVTIRDASSPAPPSPPMRFNDTPPPPSTAERASAVAAAMTARDVKRYAVMRQYVERRLAMRWPWPASMDANLETVDLGDRVVIRPKATRTR